MSCNNTIYTLSNYVYQCQYNSFKDVEEVNSHTAIRAWATTALCELSCTKNLSGIVSPDMNTEFHCNKLKLLNSPKIYHDTLLCEL